MASITETLLTAEEFLSAMAVDGVREELVRGKVVTMPQPGFRHGVCQLRTGSIVDLFARSHRLGRVTVESGLITQRDPDTVCGPDVAFWSFQRIPLDHMPGGYPDVAADLCVEIVSPSDSHHAILEKVLEYLDRGVRLVWGVDPDARTVSVYRAPGHFTILRETDRLSGEDVLPGFSCLVAELFE